MALDNEDVVSVIVPVLDNQAGINLLLDALHTQTWPVDRLEVLVVDNGSMPPISTPTASAVLVRCVICSTPGSYAARNAGAEMAKGQILAFTDADCMPERNWVAAGVDALRSHGKKAVVGGEVAFQASDRATAIEVYQRLTGFQQKENISQRGFSATANLFVARSQFASIGGFDESLLSGGDREWCWRARNKGFLLEYAEDARVTTHARTSLRGAIRQARRVAGGRFMLKRKGDRHISPRGLEPHRGLLAATKWICTHPSLSAAERLKVFGVASILKCAQSLETLRLRIGLRAERR